MPQTATLAPAAGTRPAAFVRLAVLVAATACGIAVSVAIALALLLAVAGAS